MDVQLDSVKESVLGKAQTKPKIFFVRGGGTVRTELLDIYS